MWVFYLIDGSVSYLVLFEIDEIDWMIMFCFFSGLFNIISGDFFILIWMSDGKVYVGIINFID